MLRSNPLAFHMKILFRLSFRPPIHNVLVFAHITGTMLLVVQRRILWKPEKNVMRCGCGWQSFPVQFRLLARHSKRRVWAHCQRWWTFCCSLWWAWGRNQNFVEALSSAWRWLESKEAAHSIPTSHIRRWICRNSSSSKKTRKHEINMFAAIQTMTRIYNENKHRLMAEIY